MGAVFLDWLAAPRKAAWLDVGCGTGAFTTLIVKTCKPARVAAVDPGAAQIEFARLQPVAKRADFRVADAQTLPFSDGTFDVVASALVINFIPDRARAVAADAPRHKAVWHGRRLCMGFRRRPQPELAVQPRAQWSRHRAAAAARHAQLDARRVAGPVRGRWLRRHRHARDRRHLCVQGLRHLLAHPDAAHAPRGQAGRGDVGGRSRRPDGRRAGAGGSRARTARSPMPHVRMR